MGWVTERSRGRYTQIGDLDMDDDNDRTPDGDLLSAAVDKVIVTVAAATTAVGSATNEAVTTMRKNMNNTEAAPRRRTWFRNA